MRYPLKLARARPQGQASCDFRQRTHDAFPAHVVFDSHLTTCAAPARLDSMGATFIIPRRRFLGCFSQSR